MGVLCLIRVTRQPAGDGWTAEIARPGSPPVVRKLRRTPPGSVCFPLPPEDELAALQPACAALCQDATGARLRALFQELSRDRLSAQDVGQFGDYLAATLLGPATLAALETQAKGDTLTLSILIEPDDIEIQRLPWEMLRGTEGPLCASPSYRGTVARVVATAAVAGAEPAPSTVDLKLPLRVLFVVGKAIDRSLRPGAELMGLLRRLRVPADPTYKTFRSIDLDVRYLPQATPTQIADAVADFQPSVVHVISHGVRLPNAAGTGWETLLELTPDDQPASASVRCSASELLNLLKTGTGTPPPVVVLNACHTADLNDNAEVQDGPSAFAAHLVAGGAAVAIGMAGEVADVACRMFTVRFYQALLAGESLELATSHGRRTAFQAFPGAVDWARPTLFMQQGVALRIVDGRRDVPEIANRYRKYGKFPEALCGRYDLLAAYQDLRFRVAHPGGALSPVLALRSSPPATGVGRTRAIEELATRAVFDGFVPIVLRSARNSDPPQTMIELGISISDAIDEARVNFGLGPSYQTQCRDLALLALQQPFPNGGPAAVAFVLGQLRETLREKRKASPSPRSFDGDPATVRTLVQADCGQLVRDVEAKTGEKHRALLLIDDLHLCAGVHVHVVDLTGDAGMGVPSAPIPLVFSFVTGDPVGEQLKATLAQRPDVGVIDLMPFSGHPERQLFYNQMLLSGWRCAVNQRAAESDVVALYQYLDKRSHGLAGKLVEDPAGMADFLDFCRGKVVLDADFEQQLGKWV